MTTATAVRTDWDTIWISLSEALKKMDNDSTLTLEIADDFDDGDNGANRYLQFGRFSSDMVRAEVVSNYYLKKSLRHTKKQRQQLKQIGWRKPRKREPNHHVDIHVVWVDLLGDMVVEVIRDVWGVTDVREIEVSGNMEAWSLYYPPEQLL